MEKSGEWERWLLRAVLIPAVDDVCYGEEGCNGNEGLKMLRRGRLGLLAVDEEMLRERSVAVRDGWVPLRKEMERYYQRVEMREEIQREEWAGAKQWDPSGEWVSLSPGVALARWLQGGVAESSDSTALFDGDEELVDYISEYYVNGRTLQEDIDANVVVVPSGHENSSPRNAGPSGRESQNNLGQDMGHVPLKSSNFVRRARSKEENSDSFVKIHSVGSPPGFESALDRFFEDSGRERPINEENADGQHSGTRNRCGIRTSRNKGVVRQEADPKEELPEIPNVEPRLVEMILNEALDKSPGVEWEDIAGLQFAKRCVMEAVIWPMQRPDIFKGLRGPPKGLLLFGPPGTGKTMIGRAIASKSGARFFNISASSLTSKWIGEGEKTVRALFSVARLLQPSVIFIDEIDSLLTQRVDSEQEATRRLKTEFLVQMDGAGTAKEDRILVVGATNRPQELDEAARRRMVKRLYIPLPDREARNSLVLGLLRDQNHVLEVDDFNRIVELTEGYSGSDLYALCGEAALGPVRDVGEKLESVALECVRPIQLRDFEVASQVVRASVSENDLVGYREWNAMYGSFPTFQGT
mmetsp:Transcript_2756/g.5032  ORF Transcript_2756/g.5032 Transcript_2756/m.5032 type:complete len:583 (-) Transcript_2756:1655-3403(-)